MKHNSDSDLFILTGGALVFGGLMALANSLSKPSKKKKKGMWETIYTDISKNKFTDTFGPNTIADEMEDLQTFDAELVRLLTEMNFVVTHIFSENRKMCRPTTAFAISSSKMPPYLDLGYEGQLLICDSYDELMDTGLVKAAVKRALNGRPFVFEGVDFYENPDECLRRFYNYATPNDMFITNARPSQKSQRGCAEVEIDYDDDMDNDPEVSWTGASAPNKNELTEIFWEFEICRTFLNRDHFIVASILNKMYAATILELNLNRKIDE